MLEIRQTTKVTINRKGGAMYSSNLPYSRSGLQALQALLNLHRSLVWIDPTTNSLAVKNVGVLPQSDQKSDSERTLSS